MMKLSLSYKDPLQLSETLAELGQNTRITQLDLGEGTYSMSHAMSSGVSIAEIKASKTLLYEGWGRADLQLALGCGGDRCHRAASIAV